MRASSNLLAHHEWEEVQPVRRGDLRMLTRPQRVVLLDEPVRLRTPPMTDCARVRAADLRSGGDGRQVRHPRVVCVSPRRWVKDRETPSSASGNRGGESPSH